MCIKYLDRYLFRFLRKEKWRNDLNEYLFSLIVQKQDRRGSKYQSACMRRLSLLFLHLELARASSEFPIILMIVHRKWPNAFNSFDFYFTIVGTNSNKCSPIDRMISDLIIVKPPPRAIARAEHVAEYNVGGTLVPIGNKESRKSH